MKKILQLITVIIFLNNMSFCQEIKFVVLNVNGNTTLNRNGSNITIKTGEKIFDSDKIKVGKKSYLNLVYKDGQTLEIKSAGSYTASKLISMAKSSKNSSAKKFSNFVLAEFVKSIDDLGNMRVTGAVERLVKASIDYCTPPNTNIIDPVITLSWYSIKSNSYTLKITDLPGNVLYSTELTDTTLTINLQQLNLSRDNNYKWFVKDNKKEKQITDTCRFYWLSQSSSDSIKKSLKNLSQNFEKIDPALKQTIMASFYFSNGLYIDMLQAYQKAVELAPDNDTYKNLYLSALTNLGMQRMASSYRTKLSQM